MFLPLPTSHPQTLSQPSHLLIFRLPAHQSVAREAVAAAIPTGPTLSIPAPELRSCRGDLWKHSPGGSSRGRTCMLAGVPRMGMASASAGLMRLMASPVAASHAVMRPHGPSGSGSVACCASQPEGRTVSSTHAIAALEQIQNMRDLAEAYPGIQPGRVFRSACPNAASAADIRVLREDLGIQQLVRSSSGSGPAHVSPLTPDLAVRDGMRPSSRAASAACCCSWVGLSKSDVNRLSVLQLVDGGAFWSCCGGIVLTACMKIFPVHEVTLTAAAAVTGSGAARAFAAAAWSAVALRAQEGTPDRRSALCGVVTLACQQCVH